MKKYPYVFLGIFISILIFFIFHIVSINIRVNRKIYVKEISFFDEAIEKMNGKISNVEDDGCRLAFEDMSKQIRDTYYTEDIKLKDYYNNYFAKRYTFGILYSNVSEKCNINNDNIYNKALESMAFPYEMSRQYLGAYQIKIDDVFIFKTYDKKVDELGTYSNKMLELEVLNDLLKEVEE